MLEYISAAIHAGPLAVPQSEHAVVVRAAGQVHLLGTPHRGSGELFVDAGLESHMLCLQMRLRFPKRSVEAAQGRAAVTGHESGRVQPCRSVALALYQHQPHQRLDAGQIDTPIGGNVLVVKSDVLHGSTPFGIRPTSHLRAGKPCN